MPGPGRTPLRTDLHTDAAGRPERQAAKRLRPRDAATLVIVDRTRRTPRVLMGRRHPGQVFLPDTFVFPGGRVEAGDRILARRHALPPHETERLKHAIQGRPSDARAAALALAAVRETFEETGFIVGSPHPAAQRADETGDPASWRSFTTRGFRPRLDALAFFARAITPPQRPRRYDTHFFITDAQSASHHPDAADGELLDIGWFTLEEARRLNLPSITRHIIEDLAALLSGHGERLLIGDVPFYRHRYGRLERTLLPRAGAPGRNAAPSSIGQRRNR